MLLQIRFELWFSCLQLLLCLCYFSIESEQTDEVTTSIKRHVTEEDLGLEDHKKSRVEEGEDKSEEEPQKPEDLRGVFKADGVEIELDFSKLKKESYEDEDEDHSDHFFIGKSALDILVTLSNFATTCQVTLINLQLHAS